MSEKSYFQQAISKNGSIVQTVKQYNNVHNKLSTKSICTLKNCQIYQ